MDGTLLDLAPTPLGVTAPPGLAGVLDRISVGLGGALAVITGRRISEMDQILAPLRVAASGVHGAEIRVVPSGTIQHLVPAMPAEIVRSLQRIARQTPGAFVEPKGAGIALHFRLARTTGTDIGGALQGLLEAHPGMFEVWPGQKVFEILPVGFNKGKALLQFADVPPFAGKTPVMIGDDHGDEPAFAAAERLNGVGLRVASENFGATRADFAGPGDVREWLAEIAEQLGCKSDRARFGGDDV
jgi:trehalose 6-phosphate phosphatase